MRCWGRIQPPSSGLRPWGALRRRAPDPGGGVRVGRGDAHDAGGVAAGRDAAVRAVTATARPAPPGPAAAGPILRLTRGEGTFGGTWQGEGSRAGHLDHGGPGVRLQPPLRPAQGGRGPPRRLRYRPHLVRAGLSTSGIGLRGLRRSGLAELEQRMQPRLQRGGTGMVFVTGGEPLVQGAAVGQLLRGCRERGWRTQVETNGTLAPRRLGGPDCWPDDFNVSPKLATGITGAPTRHPSGSARRRSPNCWRRAGRSGSSSPPTSMTWTRSTGGSNGSGCRSTTSGSCQRAPAPPA